jgi:hypothetical protein
LNQAWRRLACRAVLGGFVFGVGCNGCHDQGSQKNQQSQPQQTQSVEMKSELADYRPMVLDYPTDGVVLGTGWNSNGSRKVSGTCIDAATHDDSGQQTSLDLTNVIDNSELRKEFGLSASASYNAGYGKTSGRYKYVHSVEIKDDKDYFAVEAQVLNGAHYLVPRVYAHSEPLDKLDEYVAGSVSANNTHIVLLPQYASLAKSDPPAFLKACGDSFVSTIQDGGEIIARLQFDVHSFK